MSCDHHSHSPTCSHDHSSHDHSSHDHSSHAHSSQHHHSTHPHEPQRIHPHKKPDNLLPHILQQFLHHLLSSTTPTATPTTQTVVLSRIFLLTLSVATLQLIVGLWTNNFLLLCHSAHTTFDCLQIGVALISCTIVHSTHAPYTYGLQRLPVLGTFANATFSLIVALFLLVEALHRYSNGTTSSYPSTLLFLVLFSLSIKTYGIYTIQGLMLNKNDSSNKKSSLSRTLGTACRVCLCNSRKRQRGSSASSASSASSGSGHSASLDLILTMTFGDLVRGIGLMMGYLFATFNVGSASWFDIVLSWSTCAFILSSVFPIFVRTGNILLNRAPMDPHANHNIEKMVNAVVLETGVVDIQKQHYWVQTDGMVVGSISVLVDRSVDEQVITDRIHEIFRPMCFYVFTVEVQKEQMVL